MSRIAAEWAVSLQQERVIRAVKYFAPHVNPENKATTLRYLALAYLEKNLSTECENLIKRLRIKETPFLWFALAEIGSKLEREEQDE